MVNDFFLFLAGSKIDPQCQNRKFAKNPKFLKRACAAPLGFTEQNQFLPTGMCVLSYTLSCFVQQLEKIYKLYSRTPLSLSPATLRKIQRSLLCLTSLNNSRTRSLADRKVLSLYGLCMGHNWEKTSKLQGCKRKLFPTIILISYHPQGIYYNTK